MSHMTTFRRVALLAASTLAATTLPGVAAARHQSEFRLGSAFTYRGQLERAGEPADGHFDLAYELYDAREGGTFLGRIDRLDQEIHDGLLLARLDFGHEAFAGDPPWLEIHVRPAGSGPYVRLDPRQKAATTGVCTVDSDVDINGNLTLALGSYLRVGTPLHGLYVHNDRIFVNSLSDPELLINPGGGKQVGIGVSEAEAPLSLPVGPDVSPSGGGSLIVGSTSGTNIAIDGNEIMARNAGAAATLHLNAEGGDVAVGGTLLAGYEIVEGGGCNGAYVEVVCPAGKRALGGACNASTYYSGPLAIGGVEGRGWFCWFTDCTSIRRAQAICASIR